MAYMFGARSRQNLAQVHPALAHVMIRALTYSEYDFAVTEGLRSVDRQHQLVAQGRSHTLRSKHLQQSDGYAHAVDIMAVGDLNSDEHNDAQDRARTWDPEIYRAIAHAVYIVAKELQVPVRWGGDFKTFFDGPHFELI